MRFGWLSLSLSPSLQEDNSRIHQTIQQVQEAEALGFKDVWLTEHYFTGESVYNDAIVFASALAMRTETIRLGFAVVQMPFHHPVRLATQLALLDNLSNGRIDVGVGKGTVFNEYEFIGYGLRSSDSRKRTQESLEILEKAWVNKPLRYRGEFYDIDVPAIRPAPVQQPGPPIWRSVISADSFRECGRLGIPILTSRLPVSSIASRWKLYEEGLNEGGHDKNVQQQLLEKNALWRNVYVSGSDNQAEDELNEMLIKTRQHMMEVREELNPEDFTINPETLNDWTDPKVSHQQGVAMAIETGSIFGSPKKVKEQVAELRDAGVNHLLCQTGFGAMDNDSNLRSMRLFGNEVIPSFS
jgi:alkanesulfonate monooxygenase SsuD/methylene tetrahydromethanopterin reductase-like flavin-dependent oxidoreductase (luciferase family)